MSTCRSCGAPIRWTVTKTGAKMPLDPEIKERGTIYLRHADTPDEVAIVAVQPVLVPDDGLTGPYTSHFATCPDADTHRKSRAA